MRTAVVAIGGNSLVRRGEKGTVAEQQKNLAATCDGIIAILKQRYRVVVTHGNGPQVGASLLRSEMAAETVPALPLDMCVAETQGSIGYLIQQMLQSSLGRRGMGRPVVTIVTQVLVARSDPAFRSPSKPVGPFFGQQDARRKQEELGWEMREDAKRGFRRVVASPEPKAIIELLAIKKVAETGAVVISCGGGGIPVMLDNVNLVGLEAVVDKDRASGLLASQLGAEVLVISTAVEQVALDFGKVTERKLERITSEEARRYLKEGHFPPGSMGPKVEAAIHFLERGGQSVLITSPEKIPEALKGAAGTWISA